MNELLKCYVVQDDHDDHGEDMIYGCLIMNRNTRFNATQFQDRLYNEVLNTDLDLIEATDYETIVNDVLNKYHYDKNISFIPNTRSFYM